jgi:hypothetical protein
MIKELDDDRIAGRGDFSYCVSSRRCHVDIIIL